MNKARWAKLDTFRVVANFAFANRIKKLLIRQQAQKPGSQRRRLQRLHQLFLIHLL